MGTPPDGTHGPHVFVANLENPLLEDKDQHHFERVLRLRPGSPITISDSTGRWREAIFNSDIEITGEIIFVPPPATLIVIGFVVPKGDRPSWIVQKLTELGVDEIHLLSSKRSVVHWNREKAKAQQERLTRIAKEAAMQSRQVRVPQITHIRSVGEAAAQSGAVHAHLNGCPVTLEHPVIYIGPEGGWEQSELDQKNTRNLGSSVLRSETAAIAAGAALSLLRQDALDNHSP